MSFLENNGKSMFMRLVGGGIPLTDGVALY